MSAFATMFSAFSFHWAQLRDDSYAAQLRALCFSDSSQQIVSNRTKDLPCRPEKADARFGSSILSPPGALLQGQKQRNKMYQNRVRLALLISSETAPITVARLFRGGDFLQARR